MQKLSSGQIKFLTRMANGDKVNWNPEGPHKKKMYWDWKRRERKPYTPTVYRMERFGLIEKAQINRRGWRWVITELGRKILAEQTKQEYD
jgi:hypothetical protein